MGLMRPVVRVLGVETARKGGEEAQQVLFKGKGNERGANGEEGRERMAGWNDFGWSSDARRKKYTNAVGEYLLEKGGETR